MCGICGIYNYNEDVPVSQVILDGMTGTLVHRGPDDSGTYIDNYVGLGHRRLSIIDISGGKQPVSNEDNTIWATYNGEIYNYKELKNNLVQKGHSFKTNCDTEVVVHAFEEYQAECVLHFNGMFAFAIWDSKKKTLFLARDRLGIKPLYYAMSDGTFIFASEIKAILYHPSIIPELELSSVPEYLFCTSLLNGNTMFKNIFSLPAGHELVFRNGTRNIKEYWDIHLRDIAEEPADLYKHQKKIYALLGGSVGMRLMSDVPYGSLLSGGLDSTVISALAGTHTNETLKTFAMEYSLNMPLGQSNSDRKYAQLAAQAFETEHHEFMFEPEEYIDAFHKATWHMEKPIELTTPSLYLLHKKIKEYVTVVLSGEGADELFGGYFFFLNEAKKNDLTEFPWAPYFKEVSMLLDPGVERETRYKEKITASIHDLLNRSDTSDFLNKVLYLFLKIYLIEMLERQDKTSMAWGVETRVPFLDHRLVEFVANIPSGYKLRNGTEKFILKESFKNVVPSSIVQRKKKPFPFPVDPKFMFKQKNLANSLIQSGNSNISKYFDKKKVDDFFKKKNEFAGIDSLAIFRTSHALVALDLWHKAFGV